MDRAFVLPFPEEAVPIIQQPARPYLIRITSNLIRRISNLAPDQQGNVVVADILRLTEFQWRFRILAISVISILSLASIIVPFSLRYLLNLGDSSCANQEGELLLSGCDSLSCAAVLGNELESINNFLAEVTECFNHFNVTKQSLVTTCMQHTCSFFDGLPSINKNYDAVPGIAGLFMQCSFPWTAVFPLIGFSLLVVCVYAACKNYQKRPIVSVGTVTHSDAINEENPYGSGAHYIPPSPSAFGSIN